VKAATSIRDDDGHVASQCDLFEVDLTPFPDEVSGRTLATPFGVVVSRGLLQVSLLSGAMLAAAEDAPSMIDGGGNTGPCISGAGDATLLALDMSGRAVDDSRRADDSPPPVMKFSSLSTHASW